MASERNPWEIMGQAMRAAADAWTTMAVGLEDGYTGASVEDVRRGRRADAAQAAFRALPFYRRWWYWAVSAW